MALLTGGECEQEEPFTGFYSSLESRRKSFLRVSKSAVRTFQLFNPRFLKKGEKWEKAPQKLFTNKPQSKSFLQYPNDFLQNFQLKNISVPAHYSKSQMAIDLRKYKKKKYFPIFCHSDILRSFATSRELEEILFLPQLRKSGTSISLDVDQKRAR